MAHPRTKLLVIGNLPPPMNGLAAVTARMVDRFAATDMAVTVADTGAKPLANAWLSRHSFVPRRLWRMARAILLLLALGWRGRLAVYLVVNADGGMPFTTFATRLARRLRLPSWLHHHSYAYLRQPTASSRQLFAAADGHACHLVLSEGMGRLAREAYGPGTLCRTLENFVVIDRPVAAHRQAAGPLRLGHLSNLTLAKGIAEVLATQAALRHQGVPTELLLAGPFSDPEAEQLVLQAMAADPSITYAGPLHGERKAAFFAGIDVFLFPSRYHNEASPLVLMEAFAAGVPAVTTRIGAIVDLVEDGGLVVEHDFVAEAATFLAGLAADRAALARLATQAGQVFARGHDRAERQLRELLEDIAIAPDRAIPHPSDRLLPRAEGDDR